MLKKHRKNNTKTFYRSSFDEERFLFHVEQPYRNMSYVSRGTSKKRPKSSRLELLFGLWMWGVKEKDMAVYINPEGKGYIAWL